MIETVAAGTTPAMSAKEAIKNAHRQLALYFRRVSKKGEFIGFKPNSLAKTVLKIFDLKTTKDTEEIFRYDPDLGIWKADGEIAVKETAERILVSESSSHRKNDTASSVRALSYVDRSEFDVHQNFLVVGNGVLNLSTRELKPFSPEPSYLTRLQVAYDPETKFEESNCKRFFEEVTTTTGFLQSQEIFGYCLWKNYFLQKGFMLIGEGSNGKSTWIELLKAFLGAENVSAIPLQNLDSHRFAVAHLYGKLANLYADIPDQALKNTGKFKMLVGGDLLDAEEKFKDFFGFVNYAKLVFSANKIPETRDLTSAFFRRWLLLEFPNTFPEDNPKTDKNILAKLTTPKELSALLNWSLDGLDRILKNQGFTDEPTFKETEEEYLRRSSSVASFVMDMIDVEFDAEIEKGYLYKVYVIYCRKKGRSDIKSSNWFSQDLGRYCPEATPTRPHGKPRCWKNISLKEGGLKKWFPA